MTAVKITRDQTEITDNKTTAARVFSFVEKMYAKQPFLSSSAILMMLSLCAFGLSSPTATVSSSPRAFQVDLSSSVLTGENQKAIAAASERLKTNPDATVTVALDGRSLTLKAKDLCTTQDNSIGLMKNSSCFDFLTAYGKKDNRTSMLGKTIKL